MDNPALKTFDFVRSFLVAVRDVLKMARIPSDCITGTADQMTISYKAVAASMFFLFLARALEHRPNDFFGAVMVVAIFVALTLAMRGGAGALARLARYLGPSSVRADPDDASKQWFTLLAAMWTWSLFFAILHGLGNTFLDTVHLNRFFRTELFVPVLASGVSVLIVVVKTKYIDAIDLGSRRSVIFHAIFSVVFVALALRLTVFERWS